MTVLPPKVQPIAAVLFVNEKALHTALSLLERFFSPVDFMSDVYPFNTTDYYADEMGEALSRVIISFEKILDPSFLVGGKERGGEVESSCSRRGKRLVNIDVGYLDLHKLVLASYKERGNKVYLKRGVWADMTLFFRKGKVEPFPWSFPDFKTGIYDRELFEIRNRYRKKLASLKNMTPVHGS